MKKKILLFTTVAGLSVFVLSSYHAGPASNGYDCTGAETGLGNPAGCSTGSCHGSSSTSTVTVGIELDSAGIATTRYKGGMTYTVKLTVNNGTGLSLPKFGFQMGSIVGTSAVTTPSNAGTWSSSTPAGTHYSAMSAGNYVVNVVEQSMSLNATSGTTLTESFSWTAPVSGTGAISFWAAGNAVNGNGSADAGDKWNTNHVTINEWPHSTIMVNSMADVINLSAFPNPTTENMNIQLSGIQSGFYNLAVYNLSGKCVFSGNLTINDNNYIEEINSSAWNAGVYQVVISGAGILKTIPVIKN